MFMQVFSVSILIDKKAVRHLSLTAELIAFADQILQDHMRGAKLRMAKAQRTSHSEENAVQ